ncbi:MAG: chondroitinase-B domain-containing protein, partial [Paludibacter sp.]
VNSATQINGGSWSGGDTIVMKNGTWTNQAIVIKGTGTSINPIVLLAETAGNVVLTGTSKIAISGNYIVVSGLYFKNGNLSGSEVVSFRTSSTDFANNCQLTNTAIQNYNPADNTVDSKWVSLYGKNNKVDHCSFENKNNSGTLLVVWLQSGVVPNHIIDQNYFGYRNSNLDATGAELNGQEIIRVGDSSTSMQTAGVVVSNNFFEHCNGEIEIISNKSCGNLYSNNLFWECHGMLTLRHGNGCTVEGNYFFGNGISGSGGVRIIGENHKVFNNYFDKLRGTDSRSAICLVRGKLNSLANEYFQVKNALVTFNTIVDCSQSFSINYNSGTTYTMPPIGSVIAHNNVYNSTSSNVNVDVDQTDIAMDVIWKNNLMNQGKYSNFTYSAAQIITGKDPKLSLVNTTTNMYEPVNGSALSNYSTTDYPDITIDIRGRNREATAKLPGASQISGTVIRTMPKKSTVGATFINDTITAFKPITSTTEFNAYISDNQIITQVAIPGKLYIYDTSGKCLVQQQIKKGEFIIQSVQKGTYILNFISNSGIQYYKKILVM